MSLRCYLKILSYNSPVSSLIVLCPSKWLFLFHMSNMVCYTLNIYSIDDWLLGWLVDWQSNVWISLIGNSQSEEQKENRMKKMKQSFKHLWESIIYVDICTKWVPEERNRKNIWRNNEQKLPKVYFPKYVHTHKHTHTLQQIHSGMFFKVGKKYMLIKKYMLMWTMYWIILLRRK